jgi:hypothetical protein
MGGLLKIIGTPLKEVIDAVGGLIDGISTTKEEKLDARLKLVELERQFQIRMTELDGQFAQTQAAVITAEANSHSWMARNWRPILMLTFTFIVAWNYIIAPIFSVVTLPIPDDMWELMKIGVGGYVFGRSGEKMIKIFADSKKPTS